MGSADPQSVVEMLMQGVTALNPASDEPTTLEGVVSGRLICQVLMQMNPKRFEDDEEVAGVANKLSDDEISVAEREANCRMILRKLEQYFDSIERPYATVPEWRIDPSEIVVDKEWEAIARLLIIVLTAAIFCGRREVSELLDQAGEPERSYISAMMMSFTTATAQYAQNGKIAHHALERHVSAAEVEKLKKKNLALQSEINELRSGSEKIRAVEEELSRCRAELSDATERIKHNESASTSITSQFIQLQKTISELEFENDRLHRSFEAQTQTLELLRSEKKDLTDEVETLRFREGQLQRDLKQTSERQAHSSERDSQALRSKEKELEFSNRRLKDYVEQLAQFEGQTVKIQSLEQMLRNEKDQREAIQLELNATIKRCNEAEEEAFQLRRQLRSETSAARSAASNQQDDASSSSAYLSLHEELNGASISTSDPSEHSFRSADEAGTEWKTKYEVLLVEHERQRRELTDTKEILQRVSADSHSRIAGERAQSEKVTLEHMNLLKQVEEMRKANARTMETMRELEREGSAHATTVAGYEERIAGLEKVVSDAANVIRFYSCSAGGDGRGGETSAEIVKLKSQVDKLNRENDSLRTKLDQNQYEATQEQRLITSAWNEAQFELFRLRHRSGQPSLTTSPPPSTSRSGGASSARSFLSKQMDAYGCNTSSNTR